MDYKILKQDLVKEGKLVPSKKKGDPYEVFVPDRAKLKVQQVSGSTAGAGSGDFHVYRAYRRREQFRVAKILEEAEEKEKLENFIKRKEEAYKEQVERTAKKASKRKRRKENKKMWKKKLKGEAQNQFNNDGNFLEKFKAQRECAVTDISDEWKAEINKIAKRKPSTASKPGKMKDSISFCAPLIEADGKDTIVTTEKQSQGDGYVQWIFVKDKNRKILGARKLEKEELSEGGLPRMRLKDIPIGTQLEAFMYSEKYGLWKSSPYKVELQREQRLVQASNEEGLSQRLCTIIENEANLRIKEKKCFSIAFAGGVASVLGKTKCRSEFRSWRVFAAEEFIKEKKVSGEITQMLTTWGAQAEIFRPVEASDKPADDIAAAYAQDISTDVDGDIDPEFDMMVLKLDNDNSVCQLKPNSDAVKNRDVLVAGLEGGMITATIPLLDACKHIVILALGRDRKKLKSKFKDSSPANPIGNIAIKPKITWASMEDSSL